MFLFRNPVEPRSLEADPLPIHDGVDDPAGRPFGVRVLLEAAAQKVVGPGR
jgi:hypothetical protein